MSSISVKVTRSAAVLAVALLLAACSSSSSKGVSSNSTSGTTGPAGSTGSTGNGSGNQASATGVTANEIRLGLVTSQTGVEGAQFNGAVQGATARIDLQNDQGGVNGRRLTLVTADDGSTQTQAQTAVTELVSQKHVFGLLFVSGVTATAYKIAQRQGVPVVGAAVDGPEWGQQPNTNMFAVTGNQGPTGIAPNTLIPNLMKLSGATNVASLGNGNEVASQIVAKFFTTAAQSAGLKVGYQNYSIPLGAVDMTATALAMKQTGVNGFYAPMIETTVFALLSELHNEGDAMKAAVLATGYGQEIFGQPSAVRAAQGAFFSTAQAPVELKTAATQAEQAAFQKYEHYTGIPNLNWSYGWLSADLSIRGLQVAGQNPTRASFISNLRSLSDWDGGGLLPTKSDFSVQTFGKFPATSCGWFVRLQGNTFVTVNNGQPVCGKTLTS
jgi:branched-chain amino acid transport system substrate-binding protein